MIRLVGDLILKTLTRSVLQNLAADFGESFCKNVFFDIVKPIPGSVIKIDLFGSSQLDAICHTGIYIGNDEIVELTKNNAGLAEIRIVSTEKFIKGDGLFSPRTGAFIYVACGKRSNGNCYALGTTAIAQRAKAAVGRIWNGAYCLTTNNCHMFSQYCVSGVKDKHSFLLVDVENTLSKALNAHKVLWRSTGESRGSNPSFVK